MLFFRLERQRICFAVKNVARTIARIHKRRLEVPTSRWQHSFFVASVEIVGSPPKAVILFRSICVLYFIFLILLYKFLYFYVVINSVCDNSGFVCYYPRGGAAPPPKLKNFQWSPYVFAQNFQKSYWSIMIFRQICPKFPIFSTKGVIFWALSA